MRRKALILTIAVITAACFVPELRPDAGGGAFAAQPAGAAATAAGNVQKSGAYEYTGLDRRDPFLPLVVKRGPEKEKGLTPLELYDTNEIKVIAVLWEKNRYFAVFSLPDGKSYTVNEGTKVGTHNGVISKITKDAVTIRERIRDARGVIGPRDTVLRLRGEEEE